MLRSLWVIVVVHYTILRQAGEEAPNDFEKASVQSLYVRAQFDVVCSFII